MASIQNDLRLFGLDLRHLGRDARAAWSALQNSGLLSWLTPQPVVRLLQADGSTRLVRPGAHRAAPPGAKSEVRFAAVELPPDYFLHRQIHLPRGLDPDQVRAAVGLDLQSASPFPAQDLLWGHAMEVTKDGSQGACAVIASRGQVQAYLLGQENKLGSLLNASGGAAPAAKYQDLVEVWAFAPSSSQPVVLQGLGEKNRERYIATRRRWGYGLLVLVACLCTAIGVTPTAQSRLRALDAQRQHAELVQRTSSVVQQREALMSSAAQLKTLSAELSARIDPVRVLEMLTKVLPDDTYFHAFKLQGNKVTLTGQTTNASALMQLLGNQPGLRDVRAPTAANRAPGSSKDAYVIEFVLDPSAFAVVTVKPDPLPPASTSNATAAPTTATPTAPEPTQATFGGGGPSFGGAPTRVAPAAASRQASGGKP
ncbi:MAG: PilN domain-containing protein [Burkholderiales bacterium]